MIKKIQDNTLPLFWRPELTKALRFPPFILEWEVRSGENGRGEGRLLISAPRFPALRFAVFYQKEVAARLVDALADASWRSTENTECLPLIVVPYLSEERLRALEEKQVSGLDLCGNGVLLAPGQFTVFRTGYPNRYTSSRPLKNVYRGGSSLVARAFLLQPTYREVGEVQQTILRLGGEVSLATVSKALTELEDDKIIERIRQADRPQSRALRLLQPDKLLRRLEENFAPPRVRSTFLGKVGMESSPLQAAILANARRSNAALIVTGIGSATRYASLAMEKTLSVYTTNLDGLLADLPAVQTARFPNLSIQETDDPTVYFDPRPDENGFPWASPLTAYLEMARGEQRLVQTAEQIRENLLHDVTEKLL